MPTELALACACGALKGRLVAGPGARGSHVRCYCRDCQAFAVFLDKESSHLDEAGGTDVFQTTPARLEIAEGADRLALLRLSEKGLSRWYAACCDTPIANTLGTPALPFVGVLTANLGGADKDAALGPVSGVAFQKYARRAPAEKLPGVTPGYVFGFIARTFAARLRGDHKRSPFFDAEGAPVAEPRVLTDSERAQTYAKVGG